MTQAWAPLQWPNSATAASWRPLAPITLGVNNHGIGYDTNAPTVQFIGGNPTTPAAATASVTQYVKGYNTLAGGTLYLAGASGTIPLTFSGPGTGAAVSAQSLRASSLPSRSPTAAMATPPYRRSASQ